MVVNVNIQQMNSTLNAKALERALKEVTIEKACLQQQTSDLTKKLTFYEKENSCLNSLLAEKRIELKNAHKREQYNKGKVSEVKLTVNEQSNDVESLKKEINNLIEENKNLKTEKRDLKNEMRLMEAEIRSLNKKIVDGDIGSEDVDIKCDKNNAYSNNVRQTVIQLMSNAGVSRENCSKVIKIVSEGVCKQEDSS